MSIQRTLVGILALAALTALLAACGGGSAGNPSDPLDGWITFNAPDGSFTVRLPKEPEVETQTIPTEAGNIAMVLYTAETRDRAAMLTHNGFPAAIVDLIASGDATVIKSMLDSGRDGAVANVSGTLQSEKEVTVAGFPGRDFTFTVEAGQSPTGKGITGTARAVLTKDRLYQVMYLEATDKADPAVAQAFLESFQLAGGQ